MSAVPNLSHASLIEHQGFVLRLARSLLNDEAAAQDVAQEAMLVALRHPPEHTGVRSWLARVVKNRATDHARRASRRTVRESAAARHEAIESGPTPAETLEIQQDVVNAVLALDEPYRGVVIATYYEGLSPAEFAQREGTPAATVRSQLFRAHQMLRARLARRHGDDGSASRRALMSFVNARDGAFGGEAIARATPRSTPRTDGSSGTAAATASSNSSTVLLIAAGVATVSLAAGLTWYGVRHGIEASTPLAGTSSTSGETRVATLDGAEGARGPRIPMTAPVSHPDAPDEVASMQPDDLLARSRQLKAAILTRRLAVAEADLDRRFADRTDAGVVKLLDRSRVNDSLDHPGARCSGGFYSFSERSHDYDRRPQLGLDEGRLVAVPTSTGAWILDLGRADLFATEQTLSISPFPADPARTLLWETMLAPLDASMKGDRDWDMLTAEFEARRDRARADRRIVDADLARMPALPLVVAHPVVGHTYLLRSVSHDEYDVAVLLTVVSTELDACTIAWKRLSGYPADAPRVPVTTDERVLDMPTIPESFAERAVEDLTAELERVRARAGEILFDRASEATESRYGHLRGVAASGITRCTTDFSVWRELWNGHPDDASHMSFFRGEHGGSTHDLRVQSTGPATALPSLESAGREGYVVDLGELPLESVTSDSVGTANPDAVRFLCDFDFEDVARRQIAAAANPNGAPALVDASVPVPSTSPVWSDVFRQYHRHLWSVLGIGATPSVVGHTYLVRSFTPGETDVLAAFTVAEADRYGVVIAWRLLRGKRLADDR